MRAHALSQALHAAHMACHSPVWTCDRAHNCAVSPLCGYSVARAWRGGAARAPLGRQHSAIAHICLLLLHDHLSAPHTHTAYYLLHCTSPWVLTHLHTPASCTHTRHPAPGMPASHTSAWALHCSCLPYIAHSGRYQWRHQQHAASAIWYRQHRVFASIITRFRCYIYLIASPWQRSLA